MGQFTTDGELSGQVNFQMFNMGMATDDADINIPSRVWDRWTARAKSSVDARTSLQRYDMDATTMTARGIVLFGHH